MMALVDLGLFLIDVRLWNEARDRCTMPLEAMAIHSPRLRLHSIRLLWAEDFFAGFPWNQARCPPELRDACAVIQRIFEEARSNGRLVLLDEIGNPPDDVRIEPDLLGRRYPDDARMAWLWLLSWAMTPERLERGISVPTWPGALEKEKQEEHELRVFRLGASSDLLGRAALLKNDVEWDAFLEHYQRPDLRGRRVVVLGGSRAPFERARASLVAYGLAEKDFRRIPPTYEETRTKSETLARLQHADLLLVCTNRCKHTDTDHVSGPLPCARIDLNSDGTTTLVEKILDHFRDERD